MRGLRACSKAGENLQRRRKLNSLEVRIIRNDALKVKSLARQYALLIGRRNLKISWKLKIEWGWRGALRRCTWNYHYDSERSEPRCREQ
jgi:hypothetical protein